MDFIFHLGDITHQSVLDFLNQFGTVVAVRGNMDAGPWADTLPRKKIISIDGINFGLTHGSGRLSDTGKFARSQFDADINLIIFGHTHIPFTGKLAGIRMLNPGSPVDNRFDDINSFAIITIVSGRFDIEIVKFAKPAN